MSCGAVQNYPEQAMSQVFGCPEIQTKVFRFLSIPQILETREVCREWKDACHLSVSDALCCKLQQKMGCYLACTGETFGDYLAARSICPSELSVKDAFVRLAPIKCKVALGKCLSVSDPSKINEEELTKGIVHHINDWRWGFQLGELAHELGYPQDPKIMDFVRQGSDRCLTPAEQEERMSLTLKSCLPAVPKIVEIVKKTNGVPYITLEELGGEDALSKKAREAGLKAFQESAEEARIAFSSNKRRLYECFPVTLFGFDGKLESPFSIQSAIGRSFCFPMGKQRSEGEQLFEFEICPREKEVLEYDPNAPDVDFKDHYRRKIVESGKRKILYNGWEIVFSYPYIPGDETLLYSSEDDTEMGEATEWANFSIL